MSQIQIEADSRRKNYVDSGVWGRVTLDQLFKRNATRMQHDVLLVDPEDKTQFSDDIARRLTGMQCATIVHKLAARFHELGLKAGNVVGIQLPNTVEMPLTLLACMRAGLIPALLPLHWKEKDIIGALEPFAPKALISVARCGSLFPADQLRYVAASLFSVRLVLSFGYDVPDGVLSLQDVFNTTDFLLSSTTEHIVAHADAPALITFRSTSHGTSPVVRSHNHAISAGLIPLLESQIDPQETICSTVQNTSLHGLTTGFLPWLLSGGKLVLQNIYDLDLLQKQLIAEQVTRLSVPHFVLNDIVQIANTTHLKSVFAVFADPRRINERATYATLSIVDCINLDEWLLLASARQNGVPQNFTIGTQTAPSGGRGPMLAETILTPSGRIMVRGPSVPHDPAHAEGYRETSYVGSLNDDQLSIDRRFDDVIISGGVAINASDLKQQLLALEGVKDVKLDAVTDELYGQRYQARLKVIPVQGETFDAAKLRIKQACVQAGIPSYKIPVHFAIEPAFTVHQSNQKQAS